MPGRRSSGTEPSARFAYAALGVGVAMSAYYVVRGDAHPVLYVACAAYGALLSVLGAARMPRARRRIWWAFAAAQTFFLVGDALFEIYESVLHIDPYPSVADAFYVSGYPALALGMLWLIRGRRRGRDRAAFLDAAVITTGFTVVGVVFFVVPAAEAGGTRAIDQVVGAAYPAGDLLVLALVFRMFTTGMVRNAALWALVGSFLALLVADLCYVMTDVHGALPPAWMDPVYLASYILLGAASLHPSAHALSEPAPDRPDRITATRIAWLGGALMLVPLTDKIADLAGYGNNNWVVPVAGCVATVLVVLRLWDLVSDLQSKAVQLAALARGDALTGLANRRTWDHELSRACALAQEEGTPLAAAVLDLDRFKDFNDSHGHLAGDLVLKETAAAWTSILEGRGFLARFGGEEFTVLLPNMPPDHAVAVLDRMRRAVTHGQTCSIGVATWDGAESPAELVSRADQALYVAKRAGRDRIAVHDGRTATTATGSPDQHPALASLRPVYQPIVDLRTDEVFAHEALSRFEGESPRDVFDRAARDGTAVELEVAAARAALEGWDEQRPVALNVALGSLATLLEALPENLSHVIVEVTEADSVDYLPEAMLAVDALRERGARIAIDDVGVGFSNGQRVVTIRPEIMKLDMSIIRGVDQDQARQALVSAAVFFADQTGSRLVAEGIETQEERDCLERLGVTLGQGFLLGRPAPLPAVSVAYASR